MDKSLTEFLVERNKALENLDIEWVKKQLPFSSDEAALCALHKARYECTAISNSKRKQSRRWLEQHGYKRLNGIEFDKELPK